MRFQFCVLHPFDSVQMLMQRILDDNMSTTTAARRLKLTERACQVLSDSYRYGGLLCLAVDPVAQACAALRIAALVLKEDDFVVRAAQSEVSTDEIEGENAILFFLPHF